MTSKELDKAAILREIVEMDGREAVRPGDFTVEDYRRAYLAEKGIAIGRQKAWQDLGRLVESGVLLRFGDGRRNWYRRIVRD